MIATRNKQRWILFGLLKLGESIWKKNCKNIKNTITNKSGIQQNPYYTPAQIRILFGQAKANDLKRSIIFSWTMVINCCLNWKNMKHWSPSINSPQKIFLKELWFSFDWNLKWHGLTACRMYKLGEIFRPKLWKKENIT